MDDFQGAGNSGNDGGVAWTSGSTPPANWNGDIGDGADTSESTLGWLGNAIGSVLSPLDPVATSIGNTANAVEGGMQTAASNIAAVLPGTAGGWQVLLTAGIAIAILLLVLALIHEVKSL